MTIIVVGNQTFTTSLEPREQHEPDDHDADPTTEAHDFTKAVTISGKLTCTGDVDVVGSEWHTLNVYGVCLANQITSTGTAVFEGPETFVTGEIKPPIGAVLDVECRDITLSGNVHCGGLLKSANHGQSPLDFYGGSVIANSIKSLGYIECADYIAVGGPSGKFNTFVRTFENAQRASTNFIECKDLAANNLFEVDGYGELNCLAVTAPTGFGTSQDGNFSWAHSSGAGLLRLGRQQNISDTTVGLRDGIHHQRTIAGTVHTFDQQLHPSLPKLSIKGETDPGVDWIRILDDDEQVVFAVHDDGTVQTRGWASTEIDHPDVHAHTLATSGASIYIGMAMLTEVDGKLLVRHLKPPPYIPIILESSPYNLNSGNINVNTIRTIQDWFVLARDTLSGADKKNLRIRNIFPPSQHGWDFIHTEGYPIEDYEGYGKTFLKCDTILVDSIRAKTGTSLKEIRVDRIRCKTRSVWLGEKIHFATDSGVSTIQYRKDTIPVYLAALGVAESDVTALGATLANCTLAQWVTLSLAATPTAGSDDLSVIFPLANSATDFIQATTLNQLIVTPTSATGNSGIEINYPSGGHPFLQFKGSTGASNGYGNIQFGSQSTATANIFSSGYDDSLNIVVENSKPLLIDASDLRLGGVSVKNAPVSNEIFIDASYAGSVSTGSRDQPYTNLSTAMAAKLTDGSSTHYVFRLSPGTYRGAISITHTNQLQSVSIIGSGSSCTFLDTAADWSSQLTSNVLYLRNFNDIEVQGVTFTRGAYGLYLRHCKSATVTNCNFEKLGSKGTVSQHDLSANQASQAAYWASNDTSDGGACRIRDVNTVQFNDNSISYCLRGGRFQDVGDATTASMISGNKVYRTLESGLYLAAGSYTGTDGCLNVTVSGNSVYESFNNSILIIAGKKCSVVGNTCIGGANAGIQCWHVLDCAVFNNHVFDCARLSWNGVGSLADSYGSIVVDGATNIGSGTYIAILKGNSTTKCNPGRAAAVYGIAIFPNDNSLAYPTASNKLILDQNASDAENRVFNPNSIPITAVQESSSGFDGTISTTTGNSELVIESLNPTAADNRVSLEFRLNPENSNNDYKYFIRNSQIYDLVHSRVHPNGSEKEQIRCTASGAVIIGQNGAGFNGQSDGTVLMNTTRIVNQLVFHASLFHDTPASETASGERGTFLIDDDNIWLRNSSNWVKAPLHPFGYSAPSPPLLSMWSSTHQANTEQLSNGSHRLMCSQGSQSQSSQTSRFFLPTGPAAGDTIFVHALCHVELSLHSSVAGAQVYISVIDQVWNLASKQIKYQSGTHRSGTIVYTPDYSGTKSRWISDNGIIV